MDIKKIKNNDLTTISNFLDWFLSEMECYDMHLGWPYESLKNMIITNSRNCPKKLSSTGALLLNPFYLDTYFEKLSTLKKGLSHTNLHDRNQFRTQAKLSTLQPAICIWKGSNFCLFISLCCACIGLNAPKFTLLRQEGGKRFTN